MWRWSWLLLLAAGVANASVFQTISFETSEGFSSPWTATYNGTDAGQLAPSPAQSFVGTTFPGTTITGTQANKVFVWNGMYNTTNYGVADGNSALYMNSYAAAAATIYSRTRTSTGVIPSVPTERANDRYFSIKWSEIVLNSTATDNPPRLVFGINGLSTTPVIVWHDKYSATNGYKISLKANTTTYSSIADYDYQQWVTSEILLDKDLDVVTYFYDGQEVATYSMNTDITSWTSYAITLENMGSKGGMAIDYIQVGTSNTIPEPASLAIVAMLVPFLAARKRVK